MGRKNGSQKIHNVVLIIGCIASGNASAITWLQSTLTDPNPLITDRVLDFDQDILNPHRARMAFKRTLQVNGLSAEKHRAGSGFTAKAVGLDSHVLIGIREPSSPLFSTIEYFPCTINPDDRFATYEQTVSASQRKAAHWHVLVKGSVPKIEIALDGIREPTEQMALARAMQILNSWSRRLQEEWTEWDRNDSRVSEWKFYQTQAQKLADPCKYKNKFKTWAELMDPIPENPFSTEPLARSPARRTGQGDWTIRLNLTAVNMKINGQFLIDPQASASIASPDWLGDQGLETFLIEDPGKRVSKIKRKGESHFVKTVIFSDVETSGQKIGVLEFGLVNVDEYRPPEEFDVCCDGVLGVDFFRKNVVQFDATAPLGGVLIWPRSNYRAPAGYTWKEFSLEVDGSLPKKLLTELKGNTSMIFDLPHGRIWYPPQTGTKYKPRNSGIKLRFVTVKGQRLLKVVSIDPHGKAAGLPARGIKVGMNIARIHDFTVRYLNQWTVDEILKGAWGTTIDLEYRNAKDMLVKVPFSF